MFHDVCKKVDVPPLRVHDLRHSCATLPFTMGVQACDGSTDSAP
jgi:integrase